MPDIPDNRLEGNEVVSEDPEAEYWRKRQEKADTEAEAHEKLMKDAENTEESDEIDGPSCGTINW